MTAKTVARDKSKPAPKDAIALLKADHAAVSQMFAEYEVLSEYVKHHVKEEQNEMFTKANSSSLDMVELGARMAARKQDLLAQAA